MDIELKVKELIDLCGNMMFVEYYSHTMCDMWKILNPYTKYNAEKIVLDPVDNGFEHSLDLAIKVIKEKKQKFENQ